MIPSAHANTFIQAPFSLGWVSRFTPKNATGACQFATGLNRWKPPLFLLRERAGVKFARARLLLNLNKNWISTDVDFFSMSLDASHGRIIQSKNCQLPMKTNKNY